MSSAAQAHGGGTSRLDDAVAGPYRVFAWTQPEPLRVGDAHFSVAVTELVAQNNGLDVPVTDAQVTLQLWPAGETAPALVVQALPQSFLNGTFYEADVQLPTTGQWHAKIEVTGAQGSGNVTFTAEVLAARQINWLLIGVATVVLVALLALIGLWARLQSSPVQKEEFSGA
jgi:hypothetical protein